MRRFSIRNSSLVVGGALSSCRATPRHYCASSSSSSLFKPLSTTSESSPPPPPELSQVIERLKAMDARGITTCKMYDRAPIGSGNGNGSGSEDEPRQSSTSEQQGGGAPKTSFQRRKSPSASGAGGTTTTAAAAAPCSSPSSMGETSPSFAQWVERKHVCPLCRKRFSKEHVLQMHMQTRHSNDNKDGDDSATKGSKSSRVGSASGEQEAQQQTAPKREETTATTAATREKKHAEGEPPQQQDDNDDSATVTATAASAKEGQATQEQFDSPGAAAAARTAPLTVEAAREQLARVEAEVTALEADLHQTRSHTQFLKQSGSGNAPRAPPARRMEEERQMEENDLAAGRLALDDAGEEDTRSVAASTALDQDQDGAAAQLDNAFNPMGKINTRVPYSVHEAATTQVARLYEQATTAAATTASSQQKRSQQFVGSLHMAQIVGRVTEVKYGTMNNSNPDAVCQNNSSNSNAAAPAAAARASSNNKQDGEIHPATLLVVETRSYTSTHTGQFNMYKNNVTVRLRGSAAIAKGKESNNQSPASSASSSSSAGSSAVSYLRYEPNMLVHLVGSVGLHPSFDAPTRQWFENFQVDVCPEEGAGSCIGVLVAKLPASAQDAGLRAKKENEMAMMAASVGDE